MARFRTIKPDFFFDSALALLTDTARIVYIGLWCHSDRLGRLRDDRVELAAKILPYNQTAFVPALTELLRDRFVVAYEIDGVRVLLVPNFQKHQRPHHTEQASVLPDPPPDVLIGEMAVADADPSRSDGSPLSPFPSPFPFPSLSGASPCIDGEAPEPFRCSPQWVNPDPVLFRPVVQTAPPGTVAPVATGAPAVPPAPRAPAPATLLAPGPAVTPTGAPGRHKRVGANLAQDRVPTLDQVQKEVERRGLSIDVELFHAHYEANGWVQANGQPIKKWQAALTTWTRNEPRFARGPARGGSTFAMPQRASAFPPSAKALETAELEAEADQARRNREAGTRAHADQEKLDELIAQGLEEKFGDA